MTCCVRQFGRKRLEAICAAAARVRRAILAAGCLMGATFAFAAPSIAGDPFEAIVSEEPAAEMASRAANRNHYDPLIDVAEPEPVWQGTPPTSGEWIEPQTESPWMHFGLYGNAFYWMYGGPQYFSPPPPGPPPAGAKSGMLQRVTLGDTWLASGDGRRDMGVNEFQLKATLALPIAALDTPLILTPGFGANYFDGPIVRDVPAHTFDTWLDVRWMRQISQSVGIDLGVTPGWYSDYEQSSSDAFRLGARAAAAITCSPTVTIVAGVAYLDRDDVSAVPIGGLIWTPTEEWRLELMAPRPKIARRIGYDCHTTHWLYLAGEFGGGAWAVERASGAEDILYYRDWRAVFGLERTSIGGLSGRIEAGYVFGREIEYESNHRDTELESTSMVRAEISY
jgi:hypothetical protein